MTDWKYCPQCTKPLQPKVDQTGEAFPTCPEGHFTFYDNPSMIAGAIVERNGKYLVLRRNIKPNKGKWEIPGGFVDAGEGAEETVIRELEEETGLKVQIEGYVGSFPSVYGDTGIKTTCVTYHAKVTGGTWSLSEEAQEARWVDLDGFPKMAHMDDQQAVGAFAAIQRGRSAR